MKRVIFITLMMVPNLALAQQKTVECFCTDRSGARVELGQTICMYVDGRAFMAQCQMSLNNPMWREVGGDCLSS
ncbi:MAG: hypothetical protein AAGK67_04310 [Pseudomonadota bacterium]